MPPVSCSPVRRVGPRGGGQGLALRADLAEAQRVGAVQDRDDQALRQRDGDPDVDLAVADDRVGLEAGVHAGMGPQGQRDGLGDEVAERELDPLAGEPLVELLAGGDQAIDADVDGQVDLGRGLLGLDHPLGDRLAHPRVGDALGGQRRGRGRRGAAPVAARPAARRPALRPAGLELVLDVAPDDPAVGARAAEPASMSRRMIRPPGSEPRTWPRSTCDDAATLRGQRAGLDRRRPPAGRCRSASAAPPLAVAGRRRRCGRPAAAASTRLGRGRRRGLRPRPPPRPEPAATFFGSSPFFARTITRWPSATSSPAAWSMCTIVPSSYDFIGIVALSVSMSASDVPFLDLVPDLDQPLGDHAGLHRGAELRHRDFDRHVGSPWADDPANGSMIGSVRTVDSRPRTSLARVLDSSDSLDSDIQDIMDRGDDPVDRGQHRGFERPVVRDRRVLGGDAADRRVELVEDALGDPIGDPGAEPAIRPVFLDDHGAVGLDDRGQQRVEVERADRCGGRSPRRRCPPRPSFSAAASVALSERE